MCFKSCMIIPSKMISPISFEAIHSSEFYAFLCFDIHNSIKSCSIWFCSLLFHLRIFSLRIFFFIIKHYLQNMIFNACIISPGLASL